CRRCRPARTPGPDAEPKRLSWVNRRRRGFSALRSLGRLQSSRIRLDLIDSEHREMVTPPLVGSLPGPSSRPGTERDALRGRRRSSAGVGKAVAFAALALITTVIGIWQVGSSAAEYEQYQSARPCRTEPVEWGDASHCHEFRARVTEKIPARRNRGIRQNPRLEIEALDHDQPYKRSFPVTTVFRVVEVGDEMLVHGWNGKVVQTRVAEKWWDTPDTPVDDHTREMRAVGLFGAVALITVAFGVLPRLAVRTS